MQKNSKSLIALLLGIVILASAYFGAYSQYNNWVAAKAALKVTETENQRLVKAQTDSNAFLATFETNKEKVVKADKILPVGSPQTAVILGNFEQIANESGMTITKIGVIEDKLAPDETTGPNIIKAVDVDLSVKGSYEAFTNMLLRFQRNLRLVDVIDIQITTGDEENSQGTSLEFNLKFKAYYQD